MLRTHRSKGLPEIEVDLGGFGDAGGPGEEHNEGTGGEGKGGGEPRVREGVQHLLVVNVKDDVECPPRGKVDPDLEFLGRLRPRRDRLRPVGLVGGAGDPRRRPAGRRQSESFNGGEVERGGHGRGRRLGGGFGCCRESEESRSGRRR